MIKLNKLAIGMALAGMSCAAIAGDFQAVTGETVGVEAATAGSQTANIAGDAIVLRAGQAYTADNRLFVELTNGATFADSTYTLEESTGGAGTGDLTHFTLITPTPAGATRLEFRVGTSAVTTGSEFILGGSNVAGQAVTVNTPALAAGATVQIDADAQDGFGAFDFFAATTLFTYANEFSANVDTVADGVVDVNDNRLTFTGGAATDTVVLDFFQASVDNGVSLNDDDMVDIVLSGNMSGVSSVALTAGGANRGNFTIDTSVTPNTATFSASASDAFATPGSTTLTLTANGTTALATRTFTVAADLDFDAETDKNLIAAGTAAGEWTINGMQAKVSHMSLNTTGFISWLKVVNEGTAPAEITADILWTLADGTEGSVSAASLGSVDAGGVFTVSEASILTAMGNPTQLADASLTITVAGQVDLIHLTAEKKASDGRTQIPVYYNSGVRTWTQ